MRIIQKYIEHEHEYYCPYCGKVLESKETDIDRWDYITIRFCNCEDAKKERTIMSQIKELEKKLPSAKYELRPAIAEIKKI